MLAEHKFYSKLALQRLILVSYVAATLNASPVGLYNIYTMLKERQRRWADVAYILGLYNFIVFTGRVQ